jgi:hypothetical protein
MHPDLIADRRRATAGHGPSKRCGSGRLLWRADPRPQ